MKISDYVHFIQEGFFSFPTIGLDISDASLHVVEAPRRAVGLRSVLRAHTAALPEGLVHMGEIKQEKELSELLKNVLRRELRIRAEYYVVASLPEEKAFITTIQIPRVEDTKERLSAIRFEAETSIPLPASEMYFDYEDITPAGRESGHEDIAIIAYPKPVVDSYVRAIEGAGFPLAALELESQSIVRSLVYRERKESPPILIIDIGRTKSGFIIFADTAIVFTSTLPVGGRDFEQGIREATGASSDEAMRIKIEQGFSSSDERIHSALKPFVSAIIDETRKNLAFFETHPRHAHIKSAPIQNILLCGGDAYLPGFREELAAQSELSVEYGNPLRSFIAHEKQALLTQHDALSFTTALGLAMRP